MAAIVLGLTAAPAALAEPSAKSKPLPRDGAILPGPAAEPPPSPSNLPARAENLEVVGTFQVPGVRLGQIADVAVYKGFAYLNSWDDPDCLGGGTYVVDIRNAASPQLVTFIPAPANYYHGEGAHVLSVNVPGFQGDILAVNDETYGSNLALNSPCAPADKTGGGFDLYNVTDPANPVPLVQGAGDRDPDNDPATPPRSFGNSYHSVFIWQDGPRAYLVASDNVEFTDVDIFDITDPTAPVQVGDHDLLALFPEIFDGERVNGSAIFHHDMVVKHIGGRPVMKSDYWDAGYVQLDVTDPANPTLIGDTDFAEEDPLLPGSGLTPEGNAHQGEFSFDNQFLLGADEDFSPYRGVVRATTGPTAGRTAGGTEPGDTARRIADLPDGTMNGPSVFVGDACVAVAIPAAPADDANPNTEDIALIERGTCNFSDKLANVTAAGWDAAIVFNQPRPDDGAVNMLTLGATIPSVHMRRVDALGASGVLSASSTTPVAGTPGPGISVGQEFDGWGYAHLYDASTHEELDAFAIPEALDPRFASGFGDLSIHEFATDPTELLAYSSYYAGGIRVFRFSRAAGLEQTGAWIAPGGSNFWGVEQFTTAGGERLIAGSDRDFGLVLLRYTGPGAAKPPSCADSAVTTGPGQSVVLTLTCTDANGNPLTRRVVQGPANGTLGPVVGDQVTYTPGAGFAGTDTIRFVANDGAADSQPATVTVTVLAAPAAASGTPVSARPAEGMPVAAVPDRLAPRVAVAGVRARGCIRRSFMARVSVSDDSPLARVVVRLNGRAIKRSTAASFRVRVRVGSVRPGTRNTLRVVAVDSSGNRSATRRTFRRCAAAVQAPRFTG